MLMGVVAGAHLDAGLGGVLVVLVLGSLTALAFGAFGCAAALRTGSGEAVQGLFPLFFVFIFLSSSNLPRNLLRTGWFHTVATWNPISYLIEGFRSLYIYRMGRDRVVARLRGGDRPDARCPARASPARCDTKAAARHEQCTRRQHLAGGAHDRVAQRAHVRAQARPVRALAGVPAGVPGELRAAACRRSGSCPAFTSPPATPLSSSCSCCASRRCSAACSRASRWRSTSKAASRAG